VPLDWATTQTNLANALAIQGQRESGTARLEAAAVAWHACLIVMATTWPSAQVRAVRSKLDWARSEIARRQAPQPVRDASNEFRQ